MRKIIAFIVLPIILSLYSCSKGDQKRDLPFAEIPFNLYYAKMSTDTIATEIRFSSMFVLHKDLTWNLEIGGSRSYGTYSWAPIDNYFLNIKFNITKWTQVDSDTALLTKIKTVLMAVNRSSISTSPVFENDFSTYLSMYKK